MNDVCTICFKYLLDFFLVIWDVYNPPPFYSNPSNSDFLLSEQNRLNSLFGISFSLDNPNLHKQFHLFYFLKLDFVKPGMIVISFKDFQESETHFATSSCITLHIWQEFVNECIPMDIHFSHCSLILLLKTLLIVKQIGWWTLAICGVYRFLRHVFTDCTRWAHIELQ